VKKIQISVDDPGDVPKELCEKYNIKCIYTGVVIGNEVYSSKDLTPSDVYKAMEVDSVVPKTNACLESDYRNLFIEGTKDGGECIHVNISSKLSASHENAKRAAGELEGVYCQDSKMLTYGIGIQAVYAAELAAKGLGAKEIMPKLAEFRDGLDLSFIINDLKYLYKGGRVSGLKLLGANLLKIRPSLQLDKDGRMVPGRKFKGNFALAVREYIKCKLEEHADAQKDSIWIIYTDIDQKIVEQSIKDLKEAGYKEVKTMTAGATVTIHSGRNTIGLLFHK